MALERLSSGHSLQLGMNIKVPEVPLSDSVRLIIVHLWPLETIMLSVEKLSQKNWARQYPLHMIKYDSKGLTKNFSNAQFIKCDILEWEDQINMFEAAVKNSPHKSCDIVIANAGIGRGTGDSLFKLDGRYCVLGGGNILLTFSEMWMDLQWSHLWRSPKSMFWARCTVGNWLCIISANSQTLMTEIAALSLPEAWEAILTPQWVL